MADEGSAAFDAAQPGDNGGSLAALALGISACEQVASYTQPSLVRAIDASYIAPAVNIEVEGAQIARNIGQGTITPYGTLPASNNALIQVTAATGGAALVTSNGTLLAGHQHSVFLTDNGAAPNGYEVTVLEDQQIPAAAGPLGLPLPQPGAQEREPSTYI